MKIGITQRSYHDHNTHETRDTLDQAWAILLESLGYIPVPICNNILNPDRYIEALNLDGAIISGGNSSDKRDAVEASLITKLSEKNKPILGICHGAQLIHRYFGGELKEVEEHVAKRHHITLLDPSFFGLDQHELDVNSYHEWGISQSALAPPLIPLATANDATIEAFTHPELPITGLFWHPEREPKIQPHDMHVIKKVFHG